MCFFLDHGTQKWKTTTEERDVSVEEEAGEGEIELRVVTREPAAERDTPLEGEQKLKEPVEEEEEEQPKRVLPRVLTLLGGFASLVFRKFVLPPGPSISLLHFLLFFILSKVPLTAALP